MGGAILACGTGLDAQLVNPAGLYLQTKEQAQGSALLSVNDADLYSLGYMWPASDTQPAVAFSYDVYDNTASSSGYALVYTNPSRITGFSAAGADFYTYTLTYADEWSDNLIWGASAKWIDINSPKEDEGDFNLDVGVLVPNLEFLGQTFTLAGVVRDMPSHVIAGIPVHVTYDVGLACSPMPGLLIEADAFDLSDEYDSTWAVGAEYCLPGYTVMGSPILLRGGYNDETDDWSVGLGLKYNGGSLDYAYVDDDDDSFHAVTVSFTF